MYKLTCITPCENSWPRVAFRIADWLAKQSEREEEKALRKQQRLEKLKSTPRHVFEDSTTYTSQLQENMDSVEDALQKGTTRNISNLFYYSELRS